MSEQYESERAVIERTVLGCLVTFCDTLKEYIPQLCEDDFSVCPGAYKLLHSCYDAGGISTAVVFAKFAGAGKLGFIKECASAVATVHEFEPAMKRLRELNMQSCLEQGVTDLIVKKTLNVHNLRNLIEDAQAHSGVQSDESACERNLDEYMDKLGMPRDVVYTGFKTVDQSLFGLQKQTLCYIGAPASTGKTSFAINIAQAQRDKRVLFFSLEMSAKAIYDRVASSNLLIPYKKLVENHLEQEEIARIKEYMQIVRERKQLFVVDDVFGIEAIINAAMSIRPDVVIIDYIQILTTTKKIFNEKEHMDYISRELKKLAKLANCVVIGLSQVRRNDAGPPRMSDLKGSGALEADGDYILMLHRPHVTDKDESVNETECDLLIDKNKYGKTGLIKMHFAVEFQKFFEQKEIDRAQKL